MANAPISIDDNKSKMAKIDCETRAEVEIEHQEKAKASQPIPTISLVAAEQKFFDEIVKHNDHFTINHSTNVTMLAHNMYRFEKYKKFVHKMKLDDERIGFYEKQKLAYDKQVALYTTKLGLDMKDIQRMIFEEARLRIEEKKLEQMEINKQPQEVNPLMAVLEAMKK
ncbi:hypothetical protein M1D47_04040 [Bacillus sp. R1-10]